LSGLEPSCPLATGLSFSESLISSIIARDSDGTNVTRGTSPGRRLTGEADSGLQQMMMERLNQITVRLATPGDVEFLVRGNAQMALETEGRSLDVDRLRRGAQAVFDDLARGFYLIAEIEDLPVGQMMITYEWSDWRNGVFWWIQSVYTVPERRRRGVFRALYTQAEALARQQSCVCGLRLYVDIHNRGAQETYRRCGMQETAYRMFEVDHVLSPTENTGTN
jgi:GNAT superfamily N-acetyltransferase